MFFAITLILLVVLVVLLALLKASNHITKRSVQFKTIVVLRQAALRHSDTRGNMDMVKWLQSRDRDERNWSLTLFRIFFKAYSYDHTNVVRCLMEHTLELDDVRALSYALYLACFSGNLDMTKWVIKNTCLIYNVSALAGALDMACNEGKPHW